jgi:hypothetical protein
MNGFLLRAALAGGLGAFVSATLPSAPVHAALVTCPEPGFTTEPNAKVEDSTGLISATVSGKCQYITPENNSNVASINNINAAGFFGGVNWLDNGQTQIVPGGDRLSGNWSIANANFALYAYAIVFKDGNETNLTAFVFNELFSNGVWSSPFTDPPFDLPGGSTTHAVSHYTIARTLFSDCPGCGVNPVDVDVPEPASLAVLGMGMIGLAAARRRRA